LYSTTELRPCRAHALDDIIHPERRYLVIATTSKLLTTA
jgi:hypothetical protein